MNIKTILTIIWVLIKKSIFSFYSQSLPASVLRHFGQYIIYRFQGNRANRIVQPLSIVAANLKKYGASIILAGAVVTWFSFSALQATWAMKKIK